MPSLAATTAWPAVPAMSMPWRFGSPAANRPISWPCVGQRQPDALMADGGTTIGVVGATGVGTAGVVAGTGDGVVATGPATGVDGGSVVGGDGVPETGAEDGGVDGGVDGVDGAVATGAALGTLTNPVCAGTLTGADDGIGALATGADAERSTSRWPG